MGKAGTACHVEQIVRGWRRVDQLAEARETTQRHKSRALHVYTDDDGMVVFRGRLPPEAGAVLMQALAAARETLYQRARTTEDVPAETATPPTAQEQANALTLLAEPNTPGQSLLESATHVSAETSRPRACDASRVAMRHDADGHVVEVGARTPPIPPAIRRALHHRDGACRFPGCRLPFGQGHHIRHWAEGGPTTLSNLAMLRERHHRAVHEHGYQVERQPDGELRFRRPDGRPLPDVALPPAIPDDSVQALGARNEAAGLHLHARTTCPGWLGEHLDVRWAIDVLHPRALTSVAAGE